MSNPETTADDWLRVSDLVGLRQVLSDRSVVIRVNDDGTFAPFRHVAGMFFQSSLDRALSEDMSADFAAACQLATERRQRVVFRPDGSVEKTVRIAPVFDDDNDDVRFLVCWVRGSTSIDQGTAVDWQALTIDDVATRYRSGDGVVDASLWWAQPGAEPRELWPHHTHVTAMGLGHAAMEVLIMDAVEAAAETDGGPTVRISVPSADMLGGLVPVFHGALKASGLDAKRMMVAVDIALAVNPDLLPIIVHLRTMGMKVDIVGLDAHTAALHTVSDTSDHVHTIKPPATAGKGPCVDSFAAAASSTT